MKSYYRWLVLVVGLLMIGLSAYVAGLGDVTEVMPRYLSAFAALFALYVVAVFVLSRLHAPYRWTLVLIFGVAIACRVVLLTAPPTLSTDIYRYLWEGRVVAAGQNPFEKAPLHPDLEPLRDENYPSINHPHLETIYPPLTQGVFWVGAEIRATLTTQKILFTFFDVATLAVILLLLHARRRNPNLCAVYGWSPLVMTEFAHSGHNDSLGLLLLMSAILLFDRRNRLAGVTALALSFLAKYLAVLLLPFMLLRKKLAPWVALFIVIGVVGYLPFVDAKYKLISSMRVYGETWSFNSIVFALLQQWVGNGEWIRIGVLAAIGVFAVYEARRQHDLLRYTFLIVACALLLSPTVYPWYICWIVPFLCFYGSRAWLLYTGLVVASYWVWVRSLAGGAWEVGWTELIIEYVPFYALLVLEGLRALRSIGAAPAGSRR